MYKFQDMAMYWCRILLLQLSSTSFIVWLLHISSFPLRLFLFFYKWIFFINKRNLKIRGKHVFYARFLYFYKLLYEVRTKSQITQKLILIIIIIMLNLSLINNNNIIKSLEMTLNSTFRANIKCGARRKRKN